MNLCTCDCGGYVTKPENKYINGHTRRGKTNGNKQKETARLTQTGKKHTEEAKEKTGELIWERKMLWDANTLKNLKQI